jgi:hypothetical protein
MGEATPGPLPRERVVKMPSEDPEPKKFQTWMVDAVAGQFSIKITAILAVFGTCHENVVLCEQIIDQFADQCLSIAKVLPPDRSSSTATFISELRIKMLQYLSIR